MPSTQMFVQSGGIRLVSGDIYSGLPFPVGGVQLQWDAAASGPVYVGWSGTPTFLSGGSLSSGGMADGYKMSPGDKFFVPKISMCNASGLPRIDAIKLVGPATASGGVMYWQSL